MAARIDKEIKIGQAHNTSNNTTVVSLVHAYNKYYLSISPKYWQNGQWKSGKWIPLADVNEVSRLIENAIREAEKMQWIQPSKPIELHQNPTVQEDKIVSQPQKAEAFHVPKPPQKQSLLDRLKHIFAGCVALIALYFFFSPASNNHSVNAVQQSSQVQQQLPPLPPVQPPKNQPVAPLVVYIGNRGTRKFHWPGCSSVNQIKDSNIVEFNSRNAAIIAGYVPCKRCYP